MSAPETLSEKQFIAVARALADPRRWCMLREIAASDGPFACSSLSQARMVSAATISHHLKELETSGLVQILRDGKFANLVFRRDIFDAYRNRLAQL